MVKVQVRALTYGESGSGKTEMLRTFPLNVEEGEWGMIFDFDKGLNTLTNPITGNLPSGLFAKTYRDADLRPGIDTSKKMQRKAEAFKDARATLEEIVIGEGVKECIPEQFQDEQEWKDKPTLLVIDTLTSLHDVAMNLALTLDPKTGLAGAPAMHHWGAQMRLVEEFVKMCEAVQAHFVVTAHVQAWKDDVIGTSRGSILATGQKTPGLIPSWFDEVYYHTTRQTDKGIKYVIKPKNDGFFVAKSRLGLTASEVDVTLPSEVLLGKESAYAYGWGKIFQTLQDSHG